MEAVVEEVVVPREDIVHGGAGGEGGDEGAPGRLHHLHHHVVAQVLDQGHHLVPQPEGRVVHSEGGA